MKVTITSPFARVTVDLDAVDAMELVLEAVRKAVPGTQRNLVEEIDMPPVADEVDPEMDESESPRGGDSDENPIIPEQVIPKKSKPKQYRGFLHLQCDTCGEAKSMCVKVPISTYRCKCGAETSLHDLVDLNVNCRCCGKYFRYKTNLKEQTATISCLACGAPVDMEYHDRNQEYVTI